MGLFSGTCPLSNDEIKGPNAEQPIVGSLKFGTLLFYISASFALIAFVAGALLVVRHLRCYVQPRQQRQIVRIGLYPIVLAAFHCFSVYKYGLYMYLEPAGGLYEPVALAGLFLLFVEYAEPDYQNRDFFFRNLQNYKPKKSKGWSVKKEFEPVEGGSFRWFQSKWVALFCYFVASVVIEAVQMITQAAGRYCQTSYSLAFAHIYVVIISNVALPVGVIAVIQFHMRMLREPHYKAHSPTSKLLSFKAVLLLNFFQQIIFEILIATGAFKGTKTVTMTDFQVGIPALLMCFEQAICAVWFNWSFSTREYHDHMQRTNDEKLSIWHAILHVLNPMDLAYGTVYAMRLLFKGIGPWDNGSWKKGGGYDKVDGGVEDVHLKRSTTYRGRSRGLSQLSDEWQDEETGLRHGTPMELAESAAPGLSPLPRAVSPDPRTHSPSGRAPSPYGAEYGVYDPYERRHYGYDAVDPERASPPQDRARLLTRAASPARDP